MKIIFQGTHPKEIGQEKANEDSFAFSEDLTKFILCDGASESYNSQLWAKIICNSFINDDDINEDWLIDAVKKGEFKHEVRQFQKPYDNQQAEQISLMV